MKIQVFNGNMSASQEAELLKVLSLNTFHWSPSQGRIMIDVFDSFYNEFLGDFMKEHEIYHKVVDTD